MPPGRDVGPAVVLDAADLDAVLFDMDGVVTDTATTHREAWTAMFDEYLAAFAARTGRPQPAFTLDDYLAHVDGKARHDGVRSLLLARGIRLAEGSVTDPPDAETVWGLANRKNLAFQRVLATAGARTFPTSIALVRGLQERGVGTAVISASRNCRHVLSAAGVGDLFAVQVDGIEAERLSLAGKPAPDMFLEAARRLGAEAARSAVVEDAVSGVAAGKAGGFGLVIGVDRSAQADELRAAGADVVVTDLSQVGLAPAVTTGRPPPAPPRASGPAGGARPGHER